MLILKLGAFAAKTGITRWIPGIAQSDAIKYGTLTANEKKLYKLIFYCRTATVAMLNEAQQIKKSATKVKEKEIPDIPILMFSSNGQGTGRNEEQWRSYQSDFMQSVNNGKLIRLNCSHYVHDIEYKKIAEEMKKFLNELQP